MLSEKNPSFWLTIFVLVTLGAVTLTPTAAPAKPLYKGKTITFLTNQNPSGSTDTFMRLVQRHIARFIPGNPKIAFKYLPGGGGNIAPNFISHRSKPDGFTLGFFTGSVTSQAVGGPGVDYDLTKMRQIASVAEPSLYLVRKDIGNQAKDLFNPPKTIVMGGMGGTNSKDVGLLLSFDILRVPPDKFKYVRGYRGTPAAIPALRSGEMHYWAISLTGYHGTGYRAMVDEGVLAPPLFQGGLAATRWHDRQRSESR